jgi:hypothetical protein
LHNMSVLVRAQDRPRRGLRLDAKFQLSADALPADNSALSDRVRDREVDTVLGLKGDTGDTWLAWSHR